MAMVQSADPARAFAAAEQALAQNRLADARAQLLTIASIRHPAIHHLRAIVEQALGDLAAARDQFEAATRLAPSDPQLWNNFGLLLEDAGDLPAALDAYERAAALAPWLTDAPFNRALLLARLGRRGAARAAFRQLIEAQPRDPRFWNGLAAMERESGDLAAAAAAYDGALAVSAGDGLARIGRARVALERQEPDVLHRYRAARQAAPDNPELALDEAEARLDRGDRASLDDLAALARSLPDWTNGQITLARMRWERGDKEDFASHIDALLDQRPDRVELRREYVQLLAKCGEHRRAARVAHDAARVTPDDGTFRLLEAVHSGRAGDIERAEALFADLPPDLKGRATHEAVHRIRQGDLERAVACIEAGLAMEPWDLAAWGIAELLYRALGDPRADWLSGQAGLVGVCDLRIAPADFHAADLLLARLHENAVETAGQSVRDGTQTRWKLFDRVEPQLAKLKDAIDGEIAAYVSRLPPRDDRHPLLRHRDDRLRMTASWSVRFCGAGHHVAHYHPNGLISSACYFRTPPFSPDFEGWLEIGRPPPDFRMELEPIQLIEPRPGRLVLFPSFLFHGTRPFAAGERMSVAFDIAVDSGAQA